MARRPEEGKKGKGKDRSRGRAAHFFSMISDSDDDGNGDRTDLLACFLDSQREAQHRTVQYSTVQGIYLIRMNQ